MEILTGRITRDAEVSTLKDERKVVNFSIAINDSYRPKGAGELKKVVTYVNCSYWISAGIAPYLTKGTLVELCGRLSVNAYTSLSGEAKASLNFHVSNIKLLGRASGNEDPGRQTGMGNRKRAMAADAEYITAPADDLPF
jgi:single-strand DNA-binding protein